MKNVLKIGLVVIVSMSLFGCSKKDDTSKKELTTQENEVLTSTDVSYDDKEELTAKLKKDGYTFTYDNNKKTLTSVSKDKKITFTSVDNNGNYDTTFKDSNGTFLEGSVPTKENFSTCKNLIDILNKYNCNFATLDWCFVGIYTSEEKLAEKENQQDCLAIQKMTAIGYALGDKGNLSLSTTDTNGKAVTYNFNNYGEFTITDASDLPILYKWKANTGSMSSLQYDFATNTVTDIMGTFSPAAKTEFKINMMYVKQEFDKELNRAGITIDNLNEYTTVITNGRNGW